MSSFSQPNAASSKVITISFCRSPRGSAFDAEAAQEITEEPVHIQIAQIAEIETDRPAAALSDAPRSEAVEHGALLGIAQDLVGGVDLLEP